MGGACGGSRLRRIAASVAQGLTCGSELAIGRWCGGLSTPIPLVGRGMPNPIQVS